MKPLPLLTMLALFALPVAADDTPAYHPGVGDLMTALVQPRHIKLWLARQRMNWDYAAYENKNLAEMLTKVGKNTPVYRKLDLPSLITSFTAGPLSQLDSAIKAKDPAAFDQAYANLTNGCNACHRVTGQTPAQIKVPVSENGTFIDQEFGPQ